MQPAILEATLLSEQVAEELFSLQFNENADSPTCPSQRFLEVALKGPLVRRAFFLGFFY